MLCNRRPSGASRRMMTSIRSPIRNLGRRANQHLNQWTKPATATFLTGTLSDITRSRADLIAENVGCAPKAEIYSVWCR